MTKRKSEADATKPNKRQKPDLECEFCGKVYTRGTKKRKHVEDKHMGQQVLSNFRCWIDNQRFDSLEELNLHFETAHQNDTQYHITNSCFRAKYQVQSKSLNADIDPFNENESPMKVLCSKENFQVKTRTM